MSTVPMWDVALSGVSVRATETEFKRIMGIPQDSGGVPQSLLDYGRQPATEAWVYTCVWMRAMAVQQAPLRVRVKDGEGWVDIEAKEDGAGRDLQTLLDDVNEAWDASQLQAYTEAGGSVHGGSYWLLVGGQLGGPPQEIHWLSGALVEPIMGKTFPVEYEYRPSGTVGERYSVEKIVPFRDTVNLEDPYRLLSPLSAARFDISTNKQAAEWNDALLRNWGIPAGAWVAAPTTELTTTDRSYIKRALRALRGPSAQGKTPILPAGLEWKQLSMSQKDADWISSRKVSRMTICAVLGVPLVLAGDDEKASVYASTRDAERVFWRKTVLPTLTQRASRVNSHLVPRFDPTRKRLRVEYDATGVEALRGAPTEEMAAWLEAVKVGLPLNRYIEHFGLGAPVEGGDESKPLQPPQPAGFGNGGTPKPEEYDTAGKTGGEQKPRPGGDRIRVLGRGLYRHPTVRAFLETGETGGFDRLVAPEEVEELATGLRRRYSAKQILDGDPARHYPGLRNLEGPAPFHLSVPITLEEHAIKELGAGLRSDVKETREAVEDSLTALQAATAASVQATTTLATIAERMLRPKTVTRVPVRDESGRIIRVDEVVA